MTITLSRNHHALEVRAWGKEEPTLEDIHEAVIKEYPRVSRETLPTQKKIDLSFEITRRHWGNATVTMPFPWGCRELEAE